MHFRHNRAIVYNKLVKRPPLQLHDRLIRKVANGFQNSFCTGRSTGAVEERLDTEHTSGSA